MYGSVPSAYTLSFNVQEVESWIGIVIAGFVTEQSWQIMPSLGSKSSYLFIGHADPALVLNLPI